MEVKVDFQETWRPGKQAKFSMGHESKHYILEQIRVIQEICFSSANVSRFFERRSKKFPHFNIFGESRRSRNWSCLSVSSD